MHCTLISRLSYIVGSLVGVSSHYRQSLAFKLADSVSGRWMESWAKAGG